MRTEPAAIDETGQTAAVLAPVPVDVQHIAVGLDGSPFAEHAVPVARWAADGIHADVHLLKVVARDERAEDEIRYLDSVARRSHAASWDTAEDDDVTAVMVAVAQHEGSLVCLATHSRDRSAVLVGSVAVGVLASSPQPVLLAGPRARPVYDPDAPVVVAVDGSPADDHLVAVALGWANRLARRLIVVTVAEPVPGPHSEGPPPQRAHGPTEPERYLMALTERMIGAEVVVHGEVIDDAISVRNGLVPFLDATACLVVLGTKHRRGLGRAVFGSHAARVVQGTAVPALVVPTET